MSRYVYFFVTFLLFYPTASLGIINKLSNKTGLLITESYSANKIFTRKFSTINDFFSTGKNNNIIITSNITYYKNQQYLIHSIKNTMTTMQNVDEVKNLYRMPDVTFFDESDNQYTTKTFNNSLIVMYFWATWCLECTEELVQLNQLQKRLLYEDIYDIVILPISVDFKNIDTIYELYQNKKIDKIGLFIDKQRMLMNTLNIRSLPSTVLISKQNVVIANINKNTPWNTKETYEALVQLRDWGL